MKQINPINLITRGSRALLAFALALLCGTAVGQESLIEEVVVTAEFREANVQDVPLAVTAVSADMLEARSQTNLAQISAQAPNVSLRPAGSAFGNSLVAFIRGIGQTDFNPSVEPGVAIYVDDIYYSTITGNVLDLLDLDRVEILRGPQGTLAGRNAIGGAIKLFTRKPDGEDDGSVSLTYGDFDRTDIQAAGGFTIVPDKLFARVAGASRARDGYVTRLDYACANNLPDPGNPNGLPRYTQSIGCKLGEEGGQSYTAGRLGLRWIATDSLEVNFSANVVNDDSQSQPGVLVDVNPAAIANGGSLIVPIFFDNDNDGAPSPGDVIFDDRFVTGGKYFNYSTYINDGRSTPSPIFQGAPGAGDIDVYKPYVIEPVNRLHTKDYSLSFDWQLGENTSLLWVSARRSYKNSFAEDTDGSPLAVQQLLQIMNHEQDTHELRLNTSFGDGLVDLTVGAFYLDQETNEDARVDLPYVGFDFIHGPDKVPAKSKAFYSQFALHPTDRLDLTLGIRYSEDEKSYTFHRHNPDGSDVQQCNVGPPAFFFAGNPANCGVFGLEGESVSYESDRWDWRTALSFSLTDDVMLYGQVATGYKAGGNNARPFFPSQLNAFEPEELTSVEFGWKGDFANQVRVNGALFFNQYDDIQLPANTCTWAPPGQQIPCASQNNVGNAEVQGAEIETFWYPTEGVTIDFTYSWLDFEYTDIAEVSPGVPATDVEKGMVAPYTPETKWSLGAQYEASLGSGLGTLTPRIDVVFQDDIYAGSVNNDDTNLIESYSLVNARLTWRSEDLIWQADLEVTNATNEYYYLTLFDLYDQNGYIHGQPGRPREWAVSIKRNF